ncbi:MAG TPA: hypothetical protein DEB40_06060 [Elusimicrobia bacterium]|nr:hypothetical protein [Elusimicrobiota bacterium]HBT61291.1 hypothetical protein [Elusimicrobiota bacterium]
MNALNLVWLLSLGPAWAWAGPFDSSAWQWRKTFPAQAAPQARVPLDEEIFGGSRDDLADLRVSGPDGTETPYALEVEREEVRDVRVKARLYNLSRTPRRQTRFELDLGDNAAPHNYLELEIAPEHRNFRVMVRLEGSRDARSWAVLKEGGSILDFSESFRLRYCELDYPESDFRYLRLTLSDGESPLKVSAVTVRRHSRSPGLETEHPFNVAKSSTAVSAVWDLDFGQDRVPVRRLAFQARGGDFKRRVSVSIPAADGKAWIAAGENAIYRYRTPKFSGESLEIKFPEVRARRLRVEIFHYNDMPIVIEAIRAYGYSRRLRLKDMSPGIYTLHYGNPGATAPRYDLAELAGYLEDRNIQELRLSARQSNPRYTAPRRPWSEEHPWLLWTALCAAVALLASLSLRQWRQV